MSVSFESAIQAGRKTVKGSRLTRFGWFAPLLLILVDILVIEMAHMVGWLTRDISTPLFGNALNPVSFWQGALFLLVLIPGFALVNLYPGYGIGAVEQLRRRIKTIVILIFGLFVFDRIFLDASQSRAVLFLVLVGLLVVSPLTNAMARGYLARTGRWGKPAVIIGAGDKGELIANLLRANPQAGLAPIGFLDTDETYGDADETRMHASGLPVLGRLAAAATMPALARVPVAVVAAPATGECRELIEDLPFQRVVVVPELQGIPSHNVTLSEIGGLLAFDVRRQLAERHNQFIKRVFDLIFTLPLIVAIAPVMAVIALLIRIDSPGPALFRQVRCGRGGALFTAYKFRTMQIDAEARLATLLENDPALRQEYERFHKLRDDPRITRIGNFLRRSSLDELPQLWNVLKGEMSLVGPRPYMPAELLPAARQEQVILSVVPGITGFWQVYARNRASFADRKVMDGWYIQNWSIWLDLYLLFATASAVISQKHAW